MRSLHVVPTYWPAVRYGGTVSSARGLCAALAARGDDVTVLTTNLDGSRTLDVPADREVMVDGVRVRYFPVAIYRPCYSPAMGRALPDYVRAADVVHLHSVFLWPTSAAARAARRSAVPYLVSPRGMLVPDLMREKNALLKHAWLHLVGRTTLRQAAAIHATSDVERQALAALHLPLPPVRIVANGVDVSELATDDSDELLAPPPIGAQTPYVLYLGRISWKKGLDRLVRAMRYAGSSRLMIAGNDDEGYMPALERIAAAEGVAHRVDFCGPAYGAKKWALFRAARCFVLASYSENFGNTVLEAMSAGCPVVVTPEVGAASIVAQERAGIVVAGEPRLLGEAIAGLLADEGSRRRFGDAGRAAVEARHSWRARAQEMAELYRDLIERRFGPERARACA